MATDPAVIARLRGQGYTLADDFDTDLITSDSHGYLWRHPEREDILLYTPGPAEADPRAGDELVSYVTPRDPGPVEPLRVVVTSVQVERLMQDVATDWQDGDADLRTRRSDVVTYWVESVAGRERRAQLDGDDNWADVRSGRGPVKLHPESLIGMVEIAARLHVKRTTVDKWRTRGVLPEPSATVGGRPAWRVVDIQRWARETGRAK